MRIGIENVLNYVASCNALQWWLYTGPAKEDYDDEGTTGYFDSSAYRLGKENVSQEDIFCALKESLNDLKKGIYHIRLRRNSKDLRNDQIESFEIISDYSDRKISGSFSNSEIGKIQEEAYQKAKKEILTDLKIERLESENEDLKQEIKELEKEANNYNTQKLSLIGQAVDAVKNEILPNLFKSKDNAVQTVPNIGAVESSTNETQKEETGEEEIDVKRLEEVITRLREIEPEEWLNLLEGICNIHDNDISTYKLARNFLIK